MDVVAAKDLPNLGTTATIESRQNCFAKCEIFFPCLLLSYYVSDDALRKRDTRKPGFSRCKVYIHNNNSGNHPIGI